MTTRSHRRPRRELSTRTKRLIAVPLVLALMTGVAWAYWAAGSVPGGNGTSAATGVNQGATPTASVTGAAVTVSWAASTLTSGQAVSGYLIKRYDAVTPFAVQTILSACTGTITALTCLESAVPTGSWQYTVTPKFATNWLGAESAKSNSVVSDLTGPTNSITLSNITGGAYKAVGSNTVYYNKNAVGSFTLTNAVSDAGSGPASSATATLGGTTTGWTHSPSTFTTPAGGPYVSDVFSWLTTATGPATEVVTGRDIANNSTAPTLTFTNDSTPPPAGGTISNTNGYTTGKSVPVTFTAATDAGSGNASVQLQRASVALLSNGTCDTPYSSYVNVGPVSPTSVYTDTSVESGKCYKYQHIVTDRVGNATTVIGTDIAKVDYGGTINSGALSQWRLGESATSLYAEDSFTNGADAALLSNRSGETNTTWTSHAVNNTTAETFTWTTNSPGDQAIRRSSSINTAMYYTTSTPSSANYRVEADVVVKSLLSGEVAGVVGRLNTAGTSFGTFYTARYSVGTGWQLLYVLNGTTQVGVGGTYAQTLTVGEIYHLALEVNGSTISLLVDGVVRVTDTDTGLASAGRAGIRLNNSSNAGSATTGIHLDNYQLTPITYPRAVDSKGSNTGDYYNGPTLGAAGAINGSTNTAAVFDGVNSYIRLATPTGMPTGAGARSIETWLKTTSNTNQFIFSYGNEAADASFGLRLDANGTTFRARGYGSDINFTAASAVNDGAWHHVVNTYDGTMLSLYIDGVLRGSSAVTRATTIDQYGIVFGALIPPGDVFTGDFLLGSLEDVSFYTSALTQA
ncbi:MAG: hypothetical protein QOE58_1335, partial [Actinomycetota bacterium]|nr:hypothetical protein [Actinomycetota bacterium]